ncbi:MAG: cation-transporting P-type ATPase [Candidatus Altiarchaeota archaeon]|nr:cation-transporting P-type ATPase [Candidatus Altiarchaeota archaeon]
MVLETDVSKGLSTSEARLRLEKYGPNEIIERKKVSAFKLLFSQFEDPIVLIFIVSAAMSAFLGETLDFFVISVITLFIVLLGFFQEYKAEEALEKLKELIVPTSKVLRNKKLVELPIEAVVPGDIVVLEPGDMIPADCKIINGNNFAVDESMLTGESLSVEKKNMDDVYRGTIVVRGTAKVEVVSTGSKTKFGKIADLLGGDNKSKIQEKSEELAKVITKIVIWASVAIGVIGFIKGASLTSIISVAIATAIAGIPEALPLTTTIILALGVYKMVKKKAIVRRLSAVEELGTVTVICTDKTGTLTKNEMTVEKIFVDGHLIDVGGKGYNDDGKITQGDREVSSDGLEKLLVSAILCNNADLIEKEKDFDVVGDPTEVALLVAARKYGLNEDIVRNEFPRVAEEPFASEKKYMITTHRNGRKFRVLKGAPEVLLKKCTSVLINGRHEKLSRKWTKRFKDQITVMATSGLRVIAIAASNKKEWALVGLFGMQDPPRHGVDKAVEIAHKAGIKVYMITGDNPITAKSIGNKIGIVGDVVVGNDLKTMNDSELLKVLETARILARIDPEDKLRIVKILREHDEVVAMTGDGVNDAPALKESDVGISMGLRGTEVAKGASDIVLVDDNFVTIVKAIEMGRGIYDNIRKFTAFLLSWNVGVTAMILASVGLFGMTNVILLPLQILLLNVVLEDLPAIALGMDPVSKDVMSRPPRNPRENFITKKLWFLIMGLGAYMAVISTGIFYINAHNIEFARTTAFLVFSAFVIFNALNFRSLEKSTILTALRRNLMLVLAVLTSLIITVIAMYTPAGATVFKFLPVSIETWIVSLVLAFTIIPAGELLKRSIYVR